MSLATLFNSNNLTSSTKLIGISGTKGKTTLAHMLHELMTQSGIKTGLISSIGYTTNSEDFHSDVTANNILAKDLNRILKDFELNDLEFGIIEITAENIHDNVYDDLEFEAGALTNIIFEDESTFEDFDAYANTKLNFINLIRDQGYLVLNNRDKSTVDWIVSQEDKIIPNIYAHILEQNDFIVKDITTNGISYQLDDEIYNTRFVSQSNLKHAIHALRLAEKFADKDNLYSALSVLSNPPGRMDPVKKKPFTVVIDKANSKEALRNSIEEAAQMSTGRLIAVIGVTDRFRDSETISEIITKNSDIAILCPADINDSNCEELEDQLVRKSRDEAVLVDKFKNTNDFESVTIENINFRIERIIAKRLTPFISFSAQDYTGRLDAIRLALKLAKEGDVIFIAGKGDDSSIIFDGIEYEWSDYEAVEQALSEINI